MQMNNVNVVVFDQDQSSIHEQTKINYSTSRRPTANDPYASTQTQAVVINEITSLNEKLTTLQEKAERIQQYIKNSNNTTNNSEMNINVKQGNSNQLEELLRVVEIKIQIVVQQTKKIIEKMTAQFDKKLSKASSQKNHEMNSISKIQAHCRDTIAKVQQSYQEQLAIIRNQHLHLQKRLIQKVDQIQNDYRSKLQDFKNKEQQYVSTIQSLENKLRVINANMKTANTTSMNQIPSPPIHFAYTNPQTNQNINNANVNMNKSKKVYDAAQQRPISSLKSQHSDNMSDLSSQQIGSTAQNLNDTSRRRTKIFDSKNSNKSISPNSVSSKALSPLKSQENIKNDPKFIQKPQSVQSYQPYKQQRPNEPIPIPINNNMITQAKLAYHNINVKATPIPQTRPNQQMPRSQTERNLSRQQQNINNRQTVKQVPKMQVQWQKFQDFNEEENSGEEQDVFFYPERQNEPKSVFDYDQNNDSMHSPFDIK